MAGPNLDGLLNARMLVWAREMARLDIDTAAKRAGTTPERLTEWEAGTKVPTLTQLRNLSNTYKRSVGVFFLRAAPPEGEPRPVDYRRLELSVQQVISSQLAFGIRGALAKRDAALDIYKELEEPPPEFNIHVPSDVDPETAAQLIAERLGVTMESRRRWSDEYAALSGWRSAIEKTGVIVIQISGVDISEMRGAAIYEQTLPIILLNSADTPLGRLFSLLHELTHICRSESALCDEIEDAPRIKSSQEIETYCNHVAGAMLVPSEALLRHNIVAKTSNGHSEWSHQDLGALRRAFWASREVVLRRLLILGRTSRAHYQYMRRQFETEYQTMRENRDAGFVPYPRKVVLNNGRLLTKLALDAYAASAITGSEFSRFLGAKLDHLTKIRAIMREGVPS